MTTKKNTVTLEAHAARYLAEGMLAAASRSDVAPVLTGAHLTVDKGRIVAVASDRYRVHRATLDIVEKSRAHEFLLPREALLWISKNAGAYYRRRSGPFKPLVTIITTPPADGGPISDTGTVEIIVRRDASVPDRLSYVGSLIKGTFPPVARLFEVARDAETAPGELRLNLDFVSSIRALNADRGFAPFIRFTATATPGKPGPAHIIFQRGEHVYAEALVQPNLLIRGE